MALTGCLSRRIDPDSTVSLSDTRYHEKRTVVAEKVIPGTIPSKGKMVETTVLSEVKNVTADEIRVEPIKQDTGKLDIDNYLFPERVR